MHTTDDSGVSQILEYGKVVRPALGLAFAPDQSSETLGIKGEALKKQLRWQQENALFCDWHSPYG